MHAVWFKHITNNGVDEKGLLKLTIEEWMHERLNEGWAKKEARGGN